MKTTGIIRKVDELGRVVLPIELRRSLGIEVKDPLEIYVEGEAIILKKSGESCVFCGATDSLVRHKRQCVCSSCLRELTAKD